MFYNLKYLLCGFLIFCLLIAIVNFIKNNGEYNIDYTSCKPIGIYSNYQFENNRDKFLIHHINSFSSSLIYFENDSIKSNCISSVDKKDCIESMTRRKQEISKCLFEYKRLFEER